MKHQLTQARSGLSGIIVAVGILTTACGDRPDMLTEPADTAPQAAVKSGATVTIRVRLVDVDGQPIPETGKIVVSGWTPTAIWNNLYGDNVKRQDADPATGVYEVTVAVADTITVCAHPTENYTPDPAFDCPFFSSRASFVDLGDIQMRQTPRVTMLFLNWKGELVTGAKLSLTSPAGLTLNVWDGFALDLTPAGDGKVVMKLGPGTWSWCETTPPPGHVLTSPSCGTFPMAYEMGVLVTLPHAQNRSVGPGGR